jgi:hypothetical protein
MGGRALNRFGIYTERKTTAEHERILAEVKPRIEKLFNSEVRIVKYYHTKETHGDLDLLLKSSNGLNVHDEIKKEFNIEYVNSNTNVHSFAYDNYQIDIIVVKTNDWDSTFFYDYDPVGNLIGKYAHGFGLKSGFAGLVYPYRGNSGTVVKDIIISQDQEKIHKFFDLDFNRYEKGFNTVEEIFDYIIKSKYFNADRFQFDNLNGIDRKRNKKRVTYNKFLEYINSQKYTNNFIFNKDKTVYLDMINEYFPEANLLEELESLKKIDEKNKLVKEKFNGRLVMEKFNLSGKELGFVMKTFYEKYDEDYILSNSQEKLLYNVKKLIN